MNETSKAYRIIEFAEDRIDDVLADLKTEIGDVVSDRNEQIQLKDFVKKDLKDELLKVIIKTFEFKVAISQ